MLITLVLILSTFEPDPSDCAATAMIAEARAATTDGVLRVKLDEANRHAEASARAPMLRDHWWYCKQALLAFADLAPAALGPERGGARASHARQLAVELSMALGSYTGPRPPPPPLTPAEKWERRRHILVGHTAASGFFTAVGVGLLTIPWISLAVCAARYNYAVTFECGEGYGAITMSGIGAVVFVSSVIPLGIWSYRLYKHNRTPQPGVALGRARANWLGAGFHLDF